MKTRHYIAFFFIFVLFLSGSYHVAHAAGNNFAVGTAAVGDAPGGNKPVGDAPGGPSAPGSPITLVNPLGNGVDLNKFLASILDIVIQIGTVVIVLMVVYIGFQFVIARGNETELVHAKKALLWTVIGALILLGAKAIALGIQATVTAISNGT